MTDLSFTIINSDMNVEKNDDGNRTITIKPHTDISKEELLELLHEVYDKENEEEFEDIIYLNLKGLSVDLISDAIRYSLKREDLKNPLMILNIINLIKIYNTLDDSFFENENIYVSSIEDLLDLKLELKADLKAFIKQLSIYFVSMFKSYNKLTYSPLDKHIKLPNLYEKMFLTLDLLTLSGILSVSESFSLDDCVYIENAHIYLQETIMKNAYGINIMKSFIEGFENGDNN